jgi:hypothetical protein
MRKRSASEVRAERTEAASMLLAKSPAQGNILRAAEALVLDIKRQLDTKPLSLRARLHLVTAALNAQRAQRLALGLPTEIRKIEIHPKD